MHLLFRVALSCALFAPACAGSGRLSLPGAGPSPQSEKVLAARKLQQPLSQHLCKAAIYAQPERGWPLSEVTPITGRGPSFPAALEALCREADGLRLDAVTNIQYRRLPGGWSPAHELTASAIRFQAGFAAPAAPRFEDIPPPGPVVWDKEPPPAGEVAP